MLKKIICNVARYVFYFFAIMVPVYSHFVFKDYGANAGDELFVFVGYLYWFHFMMLAGSKFEALSYK